VPNKVQVFPCIGSGWSWVFLFSLFVCI